MCSPQKGYGEKRCEIPRWRPRNGCDGRLMVKILITTIQVNFCAASQNLPKLSLLKFLPLTYHHSHFLAATLGFHIFFHHSLSEGRTLFLQLGCFGLDFISFCICIPQSRPMASFGTFLTYVFFFTTGRRKDEVDVL